MAVGEKEWESSGRQGRGCPVPLVAVTWLAGQPPGPALQQAVSSPPRLRSSPLAPPTGPTPRSLCHPLPRRQRLCPVHHLIPQAPAHCLAQSGPRPRHDVCWMNEQVNKWMDKWHEAHYCPKFPKKREMFYPTLTSLPTLSSVCRQGLTAYLAPLCKLGKRTFLGRCNATGNSLVEGEPL